MNDCARFARTIRAHVAGESVPDDGGALARHAERCAGCRALLAVHGTLVDLGAHHAEPDPAQLAAMRSSVLRELARSRSRTGASQALRPSWLAPPLLRSFAVAASAVLVFLTGFVAARIGRDGSNAPVREPLLHEIAADAASNRSLVDVEDSPFLYSDVTFRPLENGRVALEFDVTQHVRTVELASSPLVQDVLAQSLLNASHTGSRLKAISLAGGGAMEPKVRDALVFALHHDETLAVRLKALDILSRQAGADPAIEAAVLVTLREDPSVQMRLSALDYLARQRIDPGAIRRAIEEIEDRDDSGAAALLVRLDEYENETRTRR